MSEGITYAIYDVETTARSDVGFAANPFDVENELVGISCLAELLCRLKRLRAGQWRRG